MGQPQSRYATDDKQLIKLLQSVMGNPSAANLYWSCFLSESIPEFEFPFDEMHDNASVENIHDELGGVLGQDILKDLDHLCGVLQISRFSAILSAFAVLMERYGNTDEFLIHHNYGVTGSKNRILRFPVTKVNLKHHHEEDTKPFTFTDLCKQQNDIIQQSSYYLCIPKLEDDQCLDHFLSVFLLDNASGHTRSIITDGLGKSRLSLIMEIADASTIVVRLNYDKRRFSNSFASNIYNQFVYTLECAIRSATCKDVHELPTVPSDQESRILGVFNRSENLKIFEQLKKPLHELIIQTAAENAMDRRVAIREPPSTIWPNGRSLTYADLVREAKNLTRHIYKSIGNRRFNENIAILLPRGIEQVIAILAVLMCGCAYVPLDPVNHPADRIDFILRDSKSICLISDSSRVFGAKYFLSKLPCVLFNHLGDERDDAFSNPTESILSSPSTADLIAYVIYTSGSTGKPKGVLVPHLGIINDVFCVYTDYMHKNFSLIENVLFSTNICFDAHVDELFLPLIFGGSITCLTSNIAESAAETPLEAIQPPLTFIQATPSVFQVIQVPQSVRCVLIGGEALSKMCLEKLMETTTASCRVIINGYGPTETTNESSLHVVKSIDDIKSIGRPLWNTQFYIMDPRTGKELVPLGAWGELYIGGIGVTKGYVNLPDLTSSVFLINHSPLFPRDEVIYKTGDAVRVNRVTNELEFRGRKSACGQIKLRGYRIELGEITYSILQANRELVKECHVAVIGGEKIVAFVVPFTGGNLSCTDLAYGSLSEYMKPSQIIVVGKFPKNISGKLDANRLLSLVGDDDGSSNPVVDSDNTTPIVSHVMSAFSSTLNIPKNSLSKDSNFFTLGGNSLNLILLRKFLLEYDGSNLHISEIKLQQLLQLQTVGKISNFLANVPADQEGESSSLTSWDKSIIIPLGEISTKEMIPFFCIHAAGGQVHTYTYLRDHLCDKVPIAFYGIQDPSLTSNLTYKLSSFETMGELYAKKISQFYPSGPLFIGGHSSGGSIAFEVAKCLERDFKRSVECVFLMDTELVFSETSPTSAVENVGNESVIPALLERIDEIRHYLYNGWKEGLMYDYIAAAAMQQSAVGGDGQNFFSRFMSTNKTTSQIWSLVKAIIPKSRKSDTSSSDLVQMISLLDHHLQIEKKYNPFSDECDLACDIFQFRPVTETLGEAVTAPSTPRGWSSLTRGRVTIIDVPNANHYNIIRPPAVDILASVIANRLCKPSTN